MVTWDTYFLAIDDKHPRSSNEVGPHSEIIGSALGKVDPPMPDLHWSALGKKLV